MSKTMKHPVCLDDVIYDNTTVMHSIGDFEQRSCVACHNRISTGHRNRNVHSVTNC